MATDPVRCTEWTKAQVVVGTDEGAMGLGRCRKGTRAKDDYLLPFVSPVICCWVPESSRVHVTPAKSTGVFFLALCLLVHEQWRFLWRVPCSRARLVLVRY